MNLSPHEAEVCEAIAERRDELVALTSALIGFDTTARLPGDLARDEAALQEFLAERMRRAGAEIDLWEPSEEEMHGRPYVPDGLDFAGRPQLIATFRGTGSGRSLVFNGHIDAVSAEPFDQWTNPPFEAQVRNGLLYGRGACDMKGGIASMVFAAEVLAASNVRLDGDLIVATNTDEESSGAGSSALVQRGLRADAGIVTEATGFDTWVACRGSEYGVVTVPGRAGHAEARQPPWQDGGAVNAIEKAMVVIEAMQRLRGEWDGRPDLEHPYLSRPDIVPTVARSGDWQVTYPASCDLTFAVMYLPAQADGDGRGAAIRDEVTQWILGQTATDDWLEHHPPVIQWWTNGVAPLEIPEDDPIVATMLGASRDLGKPGKLSGLDSWYDGETLSRLAGIPSIAYGPAGFDRTGLSVAHTIDEYVPVDDLVTCAQGLAVAAMRFCGHGDRLEPSDDVSQRPGREPTSRAEPGPA
jgi:acetylornithine deacetylase